MPLAALPTVPHAVGATVRGVDGTQVWLDLPDPADRLTLWAVGADRTAALLDLASLDSLLAELAEIRSVMASR